MIVCVKVEGKVFEVEIDSLQSQPIVARVNGTPVEVWLESSLPGAKAAVSPSAEKPIAKSIRGDVRAPIPGVVTAVSVHPGDWVSYGQEICVIDAMKMKNPIRSPRDGEIASVLIVPGQTVKHNEVLVEFKGADQPDQSPA